MKIVDINALEKIATDIRKGILTAVYSAQSGHPGGSLSCADIFTVLYFNVMNIDPKDPQSPSRDRFVLSKGHCSPALYATLARRGFFAESDLATFRKIDSPLQGHPDKNKVPGVDMSTGSLGQGLSVACGMAYASKLDRAGCRVYCLLGDGELDEGQVWEACLTASKYKLDNLCVIVDNNHLQIDGTIEEVAGMKHIYEKFRAFGFEVISIHGNDILDILNAFTLAKNVKGRPTVILANTTKGKGVSFMENKVEWHGKAPNEEEYKLAMQELGGEDHEENCN